MNRRHKNRIVEVIETEYVPISPETRKVEEWALGKYGGMHLHKHQLRILNHVFSPVDDMLPYRTVVWSCPKKSGKTATAAAVGYAWARVYGGEMYNIANALTQAKDRAFNRVKMFLEWMKGENPGLYEKIIAHVERASGPTARKPTADMIEFREPFARFEAIPCAAGSQAGGFPSLTLWDELWNYNRELLFQFYAEMQPIDTVDNSIRFIATYAGYYGESELLWQIYSDVVKPDEDDVPQGNVVEALEGLPCYVSDDGNTFVYWDHERRMPWQTGKRGDAYIEAQRHDPIVKLRPVEFARLHENRWVAGQEDFMNMPQYDGLVAEGKELGLRNFM